MDGDDIPRPALSPPMKIAVIGAGLSGLAAAWLLGRKHAVTLFERQARPGFTAASVAVPGRGAAGNAVRVDVPLRVFYPGYYPTLSRLYQALGVPSEPVSYATSFAGADGRLYFRYRNLRWGDRSVSVLAPQDLLLGAVAWRIVGALLRFHREALPALARGELAGLGIGDYVAARGYATDFVDGVQRRLLAGIADLRCNAALTRIVRVPDGGVQLLMADGRSEHFDRVVLATQANQARQLLADASEDEASVLDAFHYTPVRVITHGDAALMPARRRDWAPVNPCSVPARSEEGR